MQTARRATIQLLRWSFGNFGPQLPTVWLFIVYSKSTEK